MRKILTMLAAMIISLAANAQVLYGVSGNGLKNKSYILGTIHVVSGSFVDSIPGAKRVLDEVQQLCGEIDMRNINNPDTAAAIAQLIMMPQDSVAQDIMTQAQYDTLCRIVQESFGIDLNNPQFAPLLRMYPMMFSITVAQFGEMLKLQQKMAEDTVTETPQPIMDIFLQQQAQAAGKPVIGLETYTFQIKMLTTLSDMSLREQYDNVINGFRRKDEGAKAVQDLIVTYKSFDLVKLGEVLKKMEDFENISNRVFDSRNEDWAQKLPSIMAEKPTLLAVGVGHLLGDKGILNLLKNQGYKVKAVKK